MAVLALRSQTRPSPSRSSLGIAQPAPYQSARRRRGGKPNHGKGSPTARLTSRSPPAEEKTARNIATLSCSPAELLGESYLVRACNAANKCQLLDLEAGIGPTHRFPSSRAE